MFSRNEAYERITAKFEEDSRSILKESLNYLGVKVVLRHPLHCNRLKGRHYCILCTRTISRRNNLTEVLSQLHSVSLKELLEDAYETIYDTYNILKYDGESIFLNCLIDCGKINNNALNFMSNFPDIDPLAANHPLLIVNHFSCVGSRTLLNFLLEKFMKLSEKIFIQKQITDVLVDLIKILAGQYLRYFSYDGFCNVYDNINDTVLS